LQEDAVPFQVTVHHRVAVSLLSKVKAELDHMLQDGVISEVKQSPDWCAGIVAVPKRNSKM